MSRSAWPSARGALERHGACGRVKSRGRWADEREPALLVGVRPTVRRIPAAIRTAPQTAKALAVILRFGPLPVTIKPIP
jgi:hypothetical protein